jgi:excisionase family DNA binding protein
MSRTAERIDATHDDAPQAAALLTIKQAADFLHVERAYLIQLLDGGSLPFTGKGNQRHIHEDDLIAYQQGRDPFRRAALRELTQLSQEAGMDEVDYHKILDELP